MVSHKTRVANFGMFEWHWAGSVADPEQVLIDKAWRLANIVRVRLPGMDKDVWLHKEAVRPFTLWLTACAENGVRDNLGVCAGAWVPRFVRQSGNLSERMAKSRALDEAKRSDRLSNHSWGTAIDFDATKYPLGKGCPPGDTRWQVAELAALFGIAWGQSFSRKDPMHFELIEPLLEAGDLAK